MDPNFNFGPLFFGGGRAIGGRFEQTYKCYPVAFIRRDELEAGGKIILPPSALDRLTQLNVQYPMIFELSTRGGKTKVHAGVQEFVAEEGFCYMPYWLMQNLLIQEGNYVVVKSASLPVGSFVKLQPHSKTFLDISNPKAVLERALRGFTALTKGEEICIQYNNKNYYLTVLEAEPPHPSGGINIVEADVRVDFAAPRDYKEPTAAASNNSAAATTTATTAPVSIPGATAPSAATATTPTTCSSLEKKEDPKFKAFVGAGQRLDGRPVAVSTTPPVAPAAQPATKISTSPVAVAKPQPAAAIKPAERANSGLLFGSQPKAPAAKPAPKQPTEAAAPKQEPEKTFKPFTGAGYSLKG